MSDVVKHNSIQIMLSRIWLVVFKNSVRRINKSCQESGTFSV